MTRHITVIGCSGAAAAAQQYRLIRCRAPCLVAKRYYQSDMLPAEMTPRRQH